MKLIFAVGFSLALGDVVFNNSSMIQSGEPCQRVGPYLIESLSVPDSTVLCDSLKIRLTTFLDCKTNITRIDTTYKNGELTIAVFGTFWTDKCPRPLCPSRRINFNVVFVTHDRGILRIVVFEPSGVSLVDSVTVF